MLEVTITHNLDDAKEVRDLFDRRWIGLDWGRHGPNPEDYHHPRARQDVALFNLMRRDGAAVIAAYKGATAKRSDRVVGLVTRDTVFATLNGLLCLPLDGARIHDSSRSFLANLPARQCTIQRCHRRAKGKLMHLASGRSIERSYHALHHQDVEVLVEHYAIKVGLALAAWSGTQSQEDIDHLFLLPDDREALAQTTISELLVKKKAATLATHAAPKRELWFFGPRIAESQVSERVRYFPLEDVFDEMEKSRSGRWLVDRMVCSIGL